MYEVRLKGFSAPYAIPKTVLDKAQLTPVEDVRFVSMKNAVAVLPGEMTALQAINAAEELSTLAIKLLNTVADACGQCAEEDDCALRRGELPPSIRVDGDALEEAGIDPDSKLVCQADPEEGCVRVYPAEYACDLSDVPTEILSLFRETNVCLGALQDFLMSGEMICD